MLGIGLAMLCFVVGYNVGLRKNAAVGDTDGRSVTLERTDTVTVRDTVTELVAHRVTVIRHDTLVTPRDTVYLPIEQRHYVHTLDNDSVKGTVTAAVSGFDVNLDSLYYDLSFTQKTVVVTKRRKWGFTVGPQVGVGYGGAGLKPYVGIGISWGYSF